MKTLSDKNRPWLQTSIAVFVMAILFALIKINTGWAWWGDPTQEVHDLEKIDAFRSFSLEGAEEHFPQPKSGIYIIPNEFANYHQYQAILKTTPALDFSTAVISVGGLRAFNTAALLKRNYLFALDHSHTLNQFNLIIGNMIAQMSREEFLKAILKTTKAIKTREDFLAATDVAGINKRVSVNSKNPFAKKLYEMLPSPADGQSVWLAWLFALNSYGSSQQKWANTFWGTEESYNHIQTLIRSNRFFVIPGSLVGTNAMKAIAEFSRRENIYITEMDISNALEHVSTIDIPVILENASRLPIHKKSGMKVLITAALKDVPENFYANDPQEGLFYYLVRDLADLKSVADDLIAEDAFEPNRLLLRSADLSLPSKCSRILSQ